MNDDLVPEWAFCNQFNPHKWVSVLNEGGVDLGAQQAAFLLAQHSPEGQRAANSLLARLIKAKNNSRGLGNPSVFIHSSAQKARHRMEEMHGQGKDSWR